MFYTNHQYLIKLVIFVVLYIESCIPRTRMRATLTKLKKKARKITALINQKSRFVVTDAHLENGNFPWFSVKKSGAKQKNYEKGKWKLFTSSVCAVKNLINQHECCSQLSLVLLTRCSKLCFQFRLQKNSK